MICTSCQVHVRTAVGELVRHIDAWEIFEDRALHCELVEIRVKQREYAIWQWLASSVGRRHG